MTDFNLIKITSLALADSVNPCAMAILTMVLIAIMIKNPNKKRKILFGGFAFVSSIFIAYLFYGLILVQFFKIFADFMRENSNYIYDGLAIIAMIIGGLNIKDFFAYKPGGIVTEMPLWIRPKAKKIIDNIMSPKGAFIIGFFISIFLLPCTMGPYLIASGLLNELELLSAFFWLVYYNLIFIFPMIIIIGLIYFGFTKVEKISGWKEKNIRYLHLIAGILLFLVGFALLMKWI
jgi:cytochrome c biogenesis protein CcdA